MLFVDVYELQYKIMVSKYALHMLWTRRTTDKPLIVIPYNGEMEMDLVSIYVSVCCVTFNLRNKVIICVYLNGTSTQQVPLFQVFSEDVMKVV